MAEEQDRHSEHLPRLAVANNLSAAVHGAHLTVFDFAKDSVVFSYDATAHKISFSCVAFSKSGSKLAVGGSDKVLRVWDTASWRLIGISVNHKKISAVVFSNDEAHVLYCDKFGDVYSVALSALYPTDLHPQPSASGAQPVGPEKEAMASRVLAIGHVSQLTDLLMSQDGNFILTADRDEKVRVSHFPDCYDIQSFCMAHKELVTTVQTVKLTSGKEYVVSGSADGTMRVFDLMTGDNVVTHTFDMVNGEAAIVQCIKGASATSNRNAVVAVLLEKSTTVLIFELVETGPNTVALNQIQSLQGPSEIYSIALAQTNLYALCAEQPHLVAFATNGTQFETNPTSSTQKVSLADLKKQELEYYSTMIKQRIRPYEDGEEDDTEEGASGAKASKAKRRKTE